MALFQKQFSIQYLLQQRLDLQLLNIISGLVFYRYCLYWLVSLVVVQAPQEAV